MKKIVIILLFLAVLIGAYLGGISTAQPPQLKAALKSTKVGIVNLAAVYNNCDKVQSLRKQIEEEVAPFKKRKEELEKLAADWMEMLRNPRSKLKESSIAKGRQVILECKRQLEDLDLKFKNGAARHLQKDMERVCTEINDQIREYAARHGFHLMVAYGEPKTPLEPITRLRQLVQAIDAGQVIQLYAAGGVDVSNDVLKSLNDSYRAGQPVKDDQPK